MFTLQAQLRTLLGKKTKALKSQGQIPAVVYGPGEKNASISVDEKDFRKVFKEAGESSLIELVIGKEKRPVLVSEIQQDPITDSIIHIDFFQASLKEEVQVNIPLVFEGVAPAEKDLGGTLNKNMSELEVKALPQNLPHEIIVDISKLATFDDAIMVKDIVLPKDVVTTKNPDEVIASVLAPQKVEEELAAEITEDVESVEKVEKEKKVEDVVEEVKD